MHFANDVYNFYVIIMHISVMNVGDDAYRIMSINFIGIREFCIYIILVFMQPIPLLRSRGHYNYCTSMWSASVKGRYLSRPNLVSKS